MIFDKSLLDKIQAEFPRAACDASGRKRAFMDNGTGSLEEVRTPLLDRGRTTTFSPAKMGLLLRP